MSWLTFRIGIWIVWLVHSNIWIVWRRSITLILMITHLSKSLMRLTGCLGWGTVFGVEQWAGAPRLPVTSKSEFQEDRREDGVLWGVEGLEWMGLGGGSWEGDLGLSFGEGFGIKRAVWFSDVDTLLSKDESWGTDDSDISLTLFTVSLLLNTSFLIYTISFFGNSLFSLSSSLSITKEVLASSKRITSVKHLSELSWLLKTDRVHSLLLNLKQCPEFSTTFSPAQVLLRHLSRLTVVLYRERQTLGILARGVTGNRGEQTVLFSCWFSSPLSSKGLGLGGEPSESEKPESWLLWLPLLGLPRSGLRGTPGPQPGSRDGDDTIISSSSSSG